MQAGSGGPPRCNPRGRHGRLQPADGAVEAGTARLLREHRAAADAALTCRASLPRLAVPFPAAAD